MKLHQCGLLVLALTTVGCSYRHPEPKEAKEALKEARQASLNSVKLPSAVQNELLAMPKPEFARTVVPERLMKIAAQDVEAANFFGSLFKGSRYSVAVHPGVSGLITLELKDVTLSETLKTVADMYGFDIQRRGNVYHVYPAGLRTETIPVNYLMLSRKGLSRTAVATGGMTSSDDEDSSNSSGSSSSSSGDSKTSTNGTKIETESESNFWRELQLALQALIGNGDGRSVISSPQAGLVTVRAYPSEIKAVQAFLTQSEQHLKRQVVLEARILEVSLNEGYEQGVDWSGLSASWDGGKGVTGGGTLGGGLFGTSNSVFNTIGGGAGFKISDGNFNVAVSLLKTQGDVNTLSSPRVTATNNQKAVIKVGTDEYFVTKASTTITTSSSGVSDKTPNVELTPFFSGIALDVTPQIDDQGRVLLHIHPSVIDTEEQKKSIDMGTSGGVLELPLARSSIRESDTVVQANNGDIIVIGGLMKTNQQEIVSKVPLLGDIPWFGEAFTNRNMKNQKVELVIMLKPTVVEADTWQRELQRSSELLEKWYPTGS
ncbi:pilus (MSHA type) biogenesis protein MshL [Aeromonas simiae]|uniref:pilus (MSHA type) biogenesis protein MshL n=1 Tax=Aeromonas simiae TaxID=218936 RepID=UPI0005A6B5DF|nr:pilus (MSHA type) biogenesis protein MshL [Aeromonas simiae]